jgi:hypothetical protein
MGIKNALTDSP